MLCFFGREVSGKLLCVSQNKKTKGKENYETAKFKNYF